MRKVGMAELRRKWSGIEIAKRGKLVAVIGPARERAELDELFAGMEAIRKRVRNLVARELNRLDGVDP